MSDGDTRYRVLVEYSAPGQTTVYTKFYVDAATEEEAISQAHTQSNRDFDKLDAEVTEL